MDKATIKITDLKRIVFGEAPAEYMLEVFGRTIIIYFFLLLIIRLLGKRMSGQLTTIDLSITIMLGAIVAPPMQAPDRGILQGIFILFLVFLFHRGLSWWGVKNKKIEELAFGNMSILVKDGLLQLEEMSKTRVSRAQLYSLLRQKKIYNLGEVDRIYLEACGMFSIFKAAKPKAGLSLFPSADKGVHDYQHKVAENVYACQHCGATEEVKEKDTKCKNCGAQKWDSAVI